MVQVVLMRIRSRIRSVSLIIAGLLAPFCTLGLLGDLDTKNTLAQEQRSSYEVIHRLDPERGNVDGIAAGSLLEGSDGSVYGIVWDNYSGADVSNYEALARFFRLDTGTGDLIPLYDFDPEETGMLIASGSFLYEPRPGLVAAGEGFYGITCRLIGETQLEGKLIEIIPGSLFREIYTFEAEKVGLPQGLVASPQADRFYGYTSQGWIFEVVPGQSLSFRYHLQRSGLLNPIDLAVSPSGTIYGIALQEQDNGNPHGVIFQISMEGELSIRSRFTEPRQQMPFSLSIDQNDRLYGLTATRLFSTFGIGTLAGFPQSYTEDTNLFQIRPGEQFLPLFQFFEIGHNPMVDYIDTETSLYGYWGMRENTPAAIVRVAPDSNTTLLHQFQSRVAPRSRLLLTETGDLYGTYLDLSDPKEWRGGIFRLRP